MKWNNTIYSNIDTTGDYHIKWSESRKERQLSYDITYVKFKITQRNLSMTEKQSHGHRRLGCHRVGGWGRDGVGGWG